MQPWPYIDLYFSREADIKYTNRIISDSTKYCEENKLGHRDR